MSTSDNNTIALAIIIAVPGTLITLTCLWCCCLGELWEYHAMSRSSDSSKTNGDVYEPAAKGKPIITCRLDI